MISRQALSTLIVMLLQSVATSAYAANGLFSVMTPSDRTVFDSRTVTVVVATGQGEFDRLQFLVDGRLRREVAMVPGRKVVCIGGIPLSVGINRVTVAAYKGKARAAEETLSLMGRSDLSTVWNSPPRGYRSTPFHGSEPVRRCIPCHGLDFTATSDNPPSPPQSPCFVCHKQLVTEVRNQHGPAAVWSCLICHTGMGGDRTTMTADNSQCGECHGDAIAGWQGKQRVHGPLAVGSCTACHTPHGSDEDAFLKAPVYELCTSCHEQAISRHHSATGLAERKQLLYLASKPLRPGQPRYCISCHDPHASDSPYLLRNATETTNQAQYCQSCHTHI